VRHALVTQEFAPHAVDDIIKLYMRAWSLFAMKVETRLTGGCKGSQPWQNCLLWSFAIQALTADEHFLKPRLSECSSSRLPRTPMRAFISGDVPIVRQSINSLHC
jgi:hypothetical protein